MYAPQLTYIADELGDLKTRLDHFDELKTYFEFFSEEYDRLNKYARRMK